MWETKPAPIYNSSPDEYTSGEHTSQTQAENIRLRIAQDTCEYIMLVTVGVGTSPALNKYIQIANCLLNCSSKNASTCCKKPPLQQNHLLKWRPFNKRLTKLTLPEPWVKTAVSTSNPHGRMHALCGELFPDAQQILSECQIPNKDAAGSPFVKQATTSISTTT